jgi:hypothetical protein
VATATEARISIETADANEAGREVVRQACDALLAADGPAESTLFAVGALSAGTASLAATAGVDTCLRVLDELRATLLERRGSIDGAMRAH